MHFVLSLGETLEMYPQESVISVKFHPETCDPPPHTHTLLTRKKKYTNTVWGTPQETPIISPQESH